MPTTPSTTPIPCSWKSGLRKQSAFVLAASIPVTRLHYRAIASPTRGEGRSTSLEMNSLLGCLDLRGHLRLEDAVDFLEIAAALPGIAIAQRHEECVSSGKSLRLAAVVGERHAAFQQMHEFVARK